jgi:hypothetical protein
MSTDRGSFPSEPEPFNAAAEPPKTGHGCFFYGCVTAIVLALVAVLAISISGYFGYQAYLKLVNEYTTPTPVRLPRVEMPEEDRKALHERVDAFKKALDEGEDTEPLVLNGDELNVLLAGDASVADRVYFVVEGDTLKGQVSLPLGELGLPGLSGRYFNGKAAFHASLQDGFLVVRAESAEVNGQPISEQFMASIRNKNLAEDAAKDPENARRLNTLESLRIKDGKVIIEAKPKEERSPEAAKKAEAPGEPSKKPVDEPSPPAEPKADETPAEKPQEKPSPAAPGAALGYFDFRSQSTASPSFCVESPRNRVS